MNNSSTTLMYSLGPILYFWDRQRVVDFYDAVKDSDFDVVYMGETVCSKRRELKTGEWIELAQVVSASGKQVVLSTQALLEARSEVSTLKRLCQNGEFLVEANDMGGVQFMTEQNLPFVIGSAINVYNQHALKMLLSSGMVRWVMPVELSRDWLVNIKQACDELGIRQGFEVEVTAYGHLPLAYSARCFTARSENRPKDDCQFCCLNYPKGRVMKSQESEDLFVINGIQTLSGKCNNLINDLHGMQGLVDIVRLSPECDDMQSVLTRFKLAEEQFSNSEDMGSVELNSEDFDQRYHVNGYWNAISGMYVA